MAEEEVVDDDLDVEELEIELEDEEEEVEVEEKDEDEIKDPGKQEGVKKEEHEPKPDSKRFKQVYGKMKEMERTIQDIRESGFNKDPLVQEMKRHNEKLTKAIAKMSDSMEKDESISEASKLETRMENLLSERKVAREAHDDSGVDRINDELVELKIQLKDAEKED